MGEGLICPNCGGSDVIPQPNTRTFVYCLSCDSYADLQDAEDEAVQRRRTRALRKPAVTVRTPEIEQLLGDLPKTFQK